MSKKAHVWDFLGQVYELFIAYNPHVVGTCFGNIVVELREEVPLMDLPGIVGGKVAYYSVGGNTPNQINGRSRLLQPRDGCKDNSNYLGASVSAHEYTLE